MEHFATQLMVHLDIIFASYAVLFSIGAYAWWREESWSLEIALFVLSMIVMPLVYFAMFFLLGPSSLVAGALAIFTPQFYTVLFIACCSIWPLLKKDSMVSIPIALSFVLNFIGYIWTRGFFFSHWS
jgi:hypothetical protein